MPSILQGGKRPTAPAPKTAPADEHMPMHDGGTEATSHLISHGDGTHTIQHEDGSETQHPHIGHALMALGSRHSGGMHHHTHHDGMGGGFTTHHAAHGGEPEGPHEHENLDSVKDGMSQFFGEEEHEGSRDGGKSDGESESKDYE